MHTHDSVGHNGAGADGATANGRHSALDELQAQLDDPAKVALLQEVFSKLDVIAFSLDAVDGTLRRAETLADNVADGVQEARGSLDPEAFAALGRLVTLTPTLVDGLERLAPALRSEALAELGDPALVDALARLAERKELLLLAAESAAGFLERADEITENLSEGVREAMALAGGQGGQALAMLTQLGRLLPGVQSLLSQVEPLIESGAIEHLAESKLLAPEMVDVISKIGDALHATEVQRPEGVGLVGLMKTLRDPDARRALGYLSTFAKEFGKRLR